LKNRVFIDGASIAGLTAAARLAKFKYQVTISGESYKNTQIDGYQFDSAPLLSLPAVYRDFFQKTGKHFGQVLNVQPMDPAFVFDFGDLKINFANLSRSARLAEIEAKLGADAANEWDAILKQGEKMWDRMRENYVEWEFSLTRFNPDTYMRLRAPFVSNPYLNKILSHYATYFGYPAGIYKWSHIVAFIEESFGIWQVAGGLEALTDAIKQRAIDCGATFGSHADFDYFIDATQTHTTPTQRLLGLANYPDELPIRTVLFHKDGLTTDIYSTKLETGKFSLVLTGKLDIDNFKEYAVVDQLRAGVEGGSDNQVITKIRTANKRRFKVRHVDSLAHAGITGELLANAVRGIKNRPSHEH
jgi:hypothetical protein